MYYQTRDSRFLVLHKRENHPPRLRPSHRLQEGCHFWAGGDTGEIPRNPSVCRSYEDFESPECSTAARLSLTGVQLLDCALQLFKLLSRLAELALRRQAL